MLGKCWVNIWADPNSCHCRMVPRQKWEMGWNLTNPVKQRLNGGPRTWPCWRLTPPIGCVGVARLVLCLFDQHLRRRTNIETALFYCVVLTGGGGGGSNTGNYHHKIYTDITMMDYLVFDTKTKGSNCLLFQWSVTACCLRMTLYVAG